MNVFYIFHKIFEMNIFTDFPEPNASIKIVLVPILYIMKKNVH